jgi:Holliday junction resolvase
MRKPFEEFYVKLAGERSVVTWLENKGFMIVKWDAESLGSKNIEAKSGSQRLLIQVKSSVQQEDSTPMTSAQKEDIESRAAKIGAEAWEARVQLASNLQLVGKIKWKKLFPLEISKARMRG